MVNPSQTDKEQARAEFQELKIRTAALTDEAYQRSADNTFTQAFAAKLQEQINEINAAFAEVRKVFWPQVEEVAALLEVNVKGKIEQRLLTASDYNQYMPNLKVRIAPEGPLPLNIIEVLNSKCPVHNREGVLVRHTHILAWVPDNLSLNDLSEALGGQDGKVLFSDWFTNGEDPLGAITLGVVGKSGHWALIPDRFPPGTESKGIIDSTQA